MRAETLTNITRFKFKALTDYTAARCQYHRNTALKSVNLATTGHLL